MTNQNLVQKITQRFNKDAAANLQATYLFDVEGEGQYFLKIENQNFEVLNQFTEQPNVTLKADKETWEAIVTGEMAAQMAFMMGKLSVSGDFPLALKLPSLFALG